MTRTPIPVLCVALLLSLALVAPAPAQEDAPRIDPGSPAGTEYQLPVDRAREQARGGVSQETGSDDPPSSAPLFGEGVEPDRGATSGSGGSQAPSPSLGEAQPEIEPAPQTLRAQAPQPEGDGALLAVAGGAFGLLLLGGLGGLLWRRRRATG